MQQHCQAAQIRPGADRLNGRWDRFSWFGILKVTPEGKLQALDLTTTLTTDTLIATMEALLLRLT
jgi:hypothetical protein